MDIRRVFYVLRSIRLSGISRTLQNTLIRDRIDRHATRNITPGRMMIPGNLRHSDNIAGGYQFTFENAQLNIAFLSDNMISITWLPGKLPSTPTLEHDRLSTLNSKPLIDRSDSIKIIGEIYNITLDKNGKVYISDQRDQVLKQDDVPFLADSSWTLPTILSPEEHIYGLGERASSFNLRPGTYTSWNTDVGGTYTRGNDPLYIGTPIYLSLSPVGSHIVYFNNTFRTTFKIDETLTATFSGGALSYYVILGSLDTIYTQLGELVGRPSMPPKWSLGYHQCRWGYHTEDDIKQVINGFDKHDVPISAIHLDIDYMDHFKVFTIDKSRYPHMKKLTTELDRKGIKVVASINPAVKRDKAFDIYTDGLSQALFCKLPDGKMMHGVSWPGWSVFPDFTKPEARVWWMGLYKRLFDEGISGIWHDMNEPSSFTAWGDKSFPITTIHSMEGHGGDHLEAHNIYGLLMTQSCYQAFREYTPTKRPWIFSRSGWAGLQKYAWNWTGDIETSWEALQVTVPMILGLGLSGHAFSGVDIGGFSGSPDAELYLRWFQLGSFLSLFRTHSAIGTEPREPWSFGDNTTRIVRQFAKLRYKLLLYFYTLAWETTHTGIPPLRPIYWNDPENQALWDIEDEFLLGDALLIAPILNAGVLKRTIQLPFGTWYSFWDDQGYEGPTEIEVSLTLDTIPVFVKGGTVLPLQEESAVVFHVYINENKSSTSVLYLDEGDGYGASRIDNFRLETHDGNCNIEWNFKGEFPFPYDRVQWHFHGKNVVNARIDKEDINIVENELITPIFRKIDIQYI
jgi:alpha-glucosidase